MQADGEKRRSTRVRHRPLEWWRMETKVYKRAHNSALLSPQPCPCNTGGSAVSYSKVAQGQHVVCGAPGYCTPFEPVSLYFDSILVTGA